MKNNLKIWIGLIVVSNIAIHLAFYNTLGFHRDELLYFSLGETHRQAMLQFLPLQASWPG